MEAMLGDGGGGGGGGGRFFGGGERRLRPHNHQALKCPRCESLNTKFCYYNNYNLSQPRHFCKSCRRYWTKGGVLRNVPVGGGCRKNRRSKSKSSAAETPTQGKSRNKSDSSEGSSLTAAAATEETATLKTIPASAEEVSPSNNSSSLRNFPDARLFDVNPEANQSFENHDPSAEGEIFPTEIGGFGSLMTASEEATMGFGDIGDIPLTASFERSEPVSRDPVVDNPVQATAVEEFKMEEGLAAALDWGDGVDQGRFDHLTTGVDQGRFDLTADVDPADWSQHQWTVNDQSLHYFPYI